MKQQFLGYKIFVGNRDRALDLIGGSLEVVAPCRVLACINPHSIAVASRTPAFAKALSSADWLVADGIGVVLAARFLGLPVPSRVTGSDIFFGLLSSPRYTSGARVFFLGSTPQVLDRIRARMAREYPSVTVAGTLSPPFVESLSREQNQEIIDTINESRANILWVGMTSPKQDIWLFENCKSLESVRFAAGIGAVFDFYAETIPRPRPWARKLGLEWLVRLVREPRRLWQRTLLSAPLFLLQVLRERIGHSAPR